MVCAQASPLSVQRAHQIDPPRPIFKRGFHPLLDKHPGDGWTDRFPSLPQGHVFMLPAEERSSFTRCREAWREGWGLPAGEALVLRNRPQPLFRPPLLPQDENTKMFVFPISG